MRLFDAQLYIDRRTRLCEEVQSGIIWIMGNGESACNYKDNTYPFRQNSNLLELTEKTNKKAALNPNQGELF